MSHHIKLTYVDLKIPLKVQGEHLQVCHIIVQVVSLNHLDDHWVMVGEAAGPNTHKIQITSKTTKLFFLGCWTKVSPRLVHLPAVWRVLGNFSKHRLGKCSNRSPPPSNFLCPVSVNSSLVIPILWLGD